MDNIKRRGSRWNAILLIVYMLLVGGCPIAMAQQTDGKETDDLINAKVVDQYGNPISEVVVTIKGRDFKTVTGTEGTFSFVHQKGEVLQLAHPEYLYKEVKIKKLRDSKRVLKITLSEPFIQHSATIAGPYEDYDAQSYLGSSATIYTDKLTSMTGSSVVSTSV